MRCADALVAQGWHAELALGFERRGNRTVLATRRHDGPLVVQKPFHPEGPAVCHAIVVHPPAGIAGGDTLSLHASVGERGHALLTTPGAGKWYRSTGAGAEQRVAFDVRSGATLEWLPQESIVYDRAVASLATEVRLDATATFLGWEIVCLGRVASGERFTRGSLLFSTRIERAGRPMWVERGEVGETMRTARSRAALAGYPVFGTFICTVSIGGQGIASLRELKPHAGEGAVTALPEVVLVRYLGSSTQSARTYFASAWAILRPLATGREAVSPRIWMT